MSFRRIWTGPFPVLPGLEAHLKFDPKRDTVLTDGMALPGFLAAYEGNPNSTPRLPICPDDVKLPKGMHGKKLPITKKRGRPRLTKEEVTKKKKAVKEPPRRSPPPTPLPPVPNPYQEPVPSQSIVVQLQPRSESRHVPKPCMSSMVPTPNWILSPTLSTMDSSSVSFEHMPNVVTAPGQSWY